MANRHLSRSIVLQTLFEWDFGDKGEDYAFLSLKRNIEEFAPGIGDISFAESLLKGIFKNIAAIDTVIEKAAPEWPIEKISITDRNILRIGLFELLYSNRDDVPAKVAINEAIELAKTFGGDTSGRFVNGVLGAVYKELGEPGKNDTGRKNKKSKVDISKLPVEVLAGAVVYAKDEGEIYIALVHDIFGYWTLSKGHIGDDEEEKTGMERVVGEELGIPVFAKKELGSNEYIASHPEKGKIRKQVVYFLAEADFTDLKLEKGGGLDDAKWFKLSDILDLKMYNDILPIVTKAINILLKK